MGSLQYAGQYISIHALCEEGDSKLAEFFWTSAYFYPRPLRGGRPCTTALAILPSRISIHALCEEGDLIKKRDLTALEISIHALCEEGDSKNRDKISIFKQIIQHSARI